MLVFVVVCDLCTAYYDLHFIQICEFNFLLMFLINCFRKSVLVLFHLFLRVTQAWEPLVKNILWSQSVDVARWVRPAIEHAQDVLSAGLGQEWEYDFMLVF